MEKHSSIRIRFQESGSGWGNPLMGRVFDSDKDIPDEKLAEFKTLVEHCDLPESGELPGQSPKDVGSFELLLELPDKTITLKGDTLRADKKLQKLVSFIREHSRKEMLK